MTKALQRIMTLENELKILDSYIMELQIAHDEEIKSLELEKTSGSKHNFYWFTAKTTPLLTDVSYMSKDKHLYGFKQPPKYNFIEYHDLRFVMNCSLDDVIEQFG